MRAPPILLLALLGAACHAPAPAPAPVTGTIVGRVTDLQNAPVAGARVDTVYGPEADFTARRLPWRAMLPALELPASRTTVTDAHGGFRMRDVPTGACTLRVRHPEHAERLVGEVLVAAATTTVPAISLEPGAVVEGRFCAERGRERFAVRLAPACGPTARGFTAETTTDLDGRFRIPGRVPVDDYVLCFGVPADQQSPFATHAPPTWRLPLRVTPTQRTIRIDSGTDEARPR
ncbi:MAG: carboxypeptidase-like regulatory domain-containing protein [Planctomycetota bacterium]